MKIPKKQSDISLSKYLDYVEYVKNLSEDIDEKELILNTVRIFYNIDNALDLPYQNVVDLYNIIQNILNTKQNLVQSFNVNGVDYAINPNFNDMTFGEMVDCNTDDILTQICILYRPIVSRNRGKYIIEEYKADLYVYDQFKSSLTLDVYNGFIGFFLKIQVDLMKTIQNYLMDQDLTVEQKKILEKNGAGIAGYISSATKM